MTVPKMQVKIKIFLNSFQKYVDKWRDRCYIKVVPKMKRKGGEKMRSNLLKAKMIEAGFNQKMLASAIHISENSLSSKLLGKSQFNTAEIVAICDVLHINDNNDRAHIFLS